MARIILQSLSKHLNYWRASIHTWNSLGVGKKLIEYSHNLEEIVAERTAELQIANDQLSKLEKAKSDF